MTPEEASASLANLDSLLKQINDHVNQVLGNALLILVPWAKPIIQWIHDRVSDVSHTIEGIIGHISNTISSTIGALAPTVIDFLLGIVNNVFHDVHEILGNLATAEEFVGGAINEIMRHAPKLGEFLLGAIGGGLTGGLINTLEFLEHQDANVVNHLLDEMLKQKGMPAFLKAQVSSLRSRGAALQALIIPILLALMLKTTGEALVHPFSVNVQQETFTGSPTLALDPAETTLARLKDQLNDSDFLMEMSRNGYSNERARTILANRNERLQLEVASRLYLRQQFDQAQFVTEMQQRGVTPQRAFLTAESMRPLLSEDEIRQTFLRGIIDRPKHDQLLAQHGYTQDVIDRKVNLYFLIPGPQDLIHMGIRNVFDENIVKEFDLSGDSPPEFFKAAAQQGISHDWAMKYWQAHWIVPGTDQAFTMYQRTLDKPIDPNATEITLLDGTKVYNIIGRKTLDLFLKDKDTPPYYRQKLTEIAYHPLNRIDIRRMRIVGSLTQTQVQRAYLDLGYNLKNATLLADFVEHLAATQRKDKAQPFIDGLRRRILQYYVEEKLDEIDASFALTDLGFTVEEAKHYIAEADLLQKADDAVQMETGIGRIYVSGFVTEDVARKRLGDAKVPPKAINRLIRKWNLQRELKQDSEHFHKVRDLTKNEITEAYADKLMTRDDADTLLVGLGYPLNEADMVLSLADFKAERATRTAIQEAVKQAYVNGIRELVPTSNMLDSLGLPAPRRDALLSEWTLLRETRTEKIPLATLRDLAKTKRLDREAVFSHLKRHRYTDIDANIMLDLWQGV